MRFSTFRNMATLELVLSATCSWFVSGFFLVNDVATLYHQVAFSKKKKHSASHFEKKIVKMNLSSFQFLFSQLPSETKWTSFSSPDLAAQHFFLVLPLKSIETPITLTDVVVSEFDVSFLHPIDHHLFCRRIGFHFDVFFCHFLRFL